MDFDVTSNEHGKLDKIEPVDVFKAFSKISSIPRGSGNEQGVSDFLVEFAEGLGLEVHQDKALNVVIKKKATPGYESAPIVILQGHMDMVCEKEENISHCFETDPIRLVLNEDTLSARGTTLGADNGIAIAYAMALLQSKEIAHPPLEVLITTQEEVGLKGAARVDSSSLSGKMMINLDAEDEGKFFVSCSGGARCVAALPLAYVKADEKWAGFELGITGLKGGHSGMEIHLGRGNAIKLLGRVLQDLFELGAEIATVSGGGKVNAIPRNAKAELLIRQDNVDTAKKIVQEYRQAFARELMVSDPRVEIIFEELKARPEKIISRNVSEKITRMLGLIPSGVQSMSQDIKGLVESSLNLGIVDCSDDSLEFHCAVRSSSESLKKNIGKWLENIAAVTGASFVIDASYPAWEFKKESYIRDIIVDVFREKYRSEPEISAIHAGLECGVLGDILGEMDMISIGPDIFNVHTPDEYLSIGSVRRTWELLCDVLARLS